MLRDNHAFWRGAFIFVDLTVTICAFLAAYWIRFLPHSMGWESFYGLTILDAYIHTTDPIPPFTAYLRVVPALALGMGITNSYFRLYHPRRTSSFVDEMAAVVKSNFMALLLIVTFFFFNRHISWSRSVFLIFFVFNPIALILFRITLRSCLRILRARGYNLRRVLVVGTGRTAQELVLRLLDNPWTGIRVVGLISKSENRIGKKTHGIPVIGTTDDICSKATELGIDHVYIALPGQDRPLLERLVEELSVRFVAVRIVPDIGYYLAPHHLTDFDGLPVVSVWENRPSGWEAILKRSLDVSIASIGIISCLPIFLFIALVVKTSSRGPVLYIQKRMGLDGKIFPILKFRTMRLNSESSDWTRPGDSRCTGFGRLLRRTSLDELPQLFNVLIGQMSLVGPRPERPILIEEFRKRFPHYMLRHQVKAGITGWAQVNGWRGNTSLRKRLQYDLYYLRHWSIWFDIKIILMTFMRGIIHRNAY